MYAIRSYYEVVAFDASRHNTVDALLNEASRNLAQQPPSDTVLLVTAPRLDKTALAVKWVKALEAEVV